MAGPTLNPGPNSDVTQDPDESSNRYDTYLAVDPKDPAHMVGVCRRFFTNDPNPYKDVLEVQYTFNAGTNWGTVALTVPTIPGTNNSYYSVSDPWIGIAPNGNVYVIGLAVTSSQEDTSAAVCCYTSTNGGETWSSAVVIPGTPGGRDNTFGAVDSAPNSGLVYAIWNDASNGTLGFAWSLDGTNWNASLGTENLRHRPIPGASPYALPIQGYNFVNMSVNPHDGSIHIIGAGPSANATGLNNTVDVCYARSTDKGKTFEFGAIATNQVNTGGITGLFNPMPGQASPILAVANPPSIIAFGPGVIYAAWSVDTGEGNGANPLMRICIAGCSDNGKQWLKYHAPRPVPTRPMPVHIPPPPAKPPAPQAIPFLPLGNLPAQPQDQYFMPRLAASPNGRFVGCAFLHCQTSGAPPQLDTTTLNTCLAVSLAPIAGIPLAQLETEARNYFVAGTTTTITVSDEATSPVATHPVFRWGTANAYFIGDFIGLGANAGSFLPYWSDTRNGTAQIMISDVSLEP